MVIAIQARLGARADDVAAVVIEVEDITDAVDVYEAIHSKIPNHDPHRELKTALLLEAVHNGNYEEIMK